MLAGRLALQLGIDDPEQWLELQPERVIAFWEAFDAIEPIGCEWERWASLMSMVESVFAAILNQNLQKQDRITPRNPEQFLPREMRSKKVRKASLAQQLEAFKRWVG